MQAPWHSVAAGATPFFSREREARSFSDRCGGAGEVALYYPGGEENKKSFTLLQCAIGEIRRGQKVKGKDMVTSGQVLDLPPWKHWLAVPGEWVRAVCVMSLSFCDEDESGCLFPVGTGGRMGRNTSWALHYTSSYVAFYRRHSLKKAIDQETIHKGTQA